MPDQCNDVTYSHYHIVNSTNCEDCYLFVGFASYNRFVFDVQELVLAENVGGMTSEGEEVLTRL
uniref:Uncharacterized protein n=1 Tax=Anguilla anguilla TaxID=7936 RepID=A0A0E9X3Q9_ANGAN